MLLGRSFNGSWTRILRGSSEEWRMLNEVLPAMLKEAGTDYLFVDYVKDWAGRRKVPLPLP